MQTAAMTTNVPISCEIREDVVTTR